MIPFIVKGTIDIIPHDRNDSYSFEDIRIVMAVDQEDAENKYEKYWEHQEDKYSDVCSIISFEVMETLL